MVQKEDDVEKFFRDNFSSLFPNWTLLTEQDARTIQHGKHKGKILDDLAFSKEKKTFYIFEYKAEIYKEQINQAQTYRNALQEDANRYHLRDVWNKHLKEKREEEWELSNFEWKSMKIICVNIQFTYWQQGAENEETILVKMTKYQNETHFFVRLESKYFEFPSDEEVDTKILCLQLKANEWIKEKSKKIDDLVSPYISEKEILRWENCVAYKRKNGVWLLLIEVQQRQFKVYFEDNKITEELDYYKDDWLKNLCREIICKTDKDQSFERCYNLLVKYLEHTKKQ